MKLFALHSSREFGVMVAKAIGEELAPHEEIDFEDGEHKTRPLVNVRGENVFVIQSLYSDTLQTGDDKLIRLLFFIAALKDASAARVTAVIPYLSYARKDRKTKPRDPISTRYIAQLVEAVGTDHIVTIDVHNIQAFQNAFRRPTEHLSALKTFIDYLLPKIAQQDVVIMSPDIGGIKRAELLQRSLTKRLDKELPLVFMEKFRSGGQVWGERVVGDVNEKTVIIIDDLLSTGGTIARSAAACKRSGASKVIAVVTHGLFTGAAGETLQEPGLDQLIVTNTIPPFRLDASTVKQKLTVLDVTPLFAEVIKRLYTGGSIAELLISD